MTSPHDDIDDWLDAEVTPLSPPPGSLDRIRHRARQRKVRQATLAAVGCAVVLGAAVSVPQVILAGSHPGRTPPPVAIGSTPVSPQPTGSRNSPSPETSTQAPLVPQRSQLSMTTSGKPVPSNFQPTSVTFAGTGADSVVGAVIGQAGTPGHCSTSDCTSLAGTSSYGGTWYGVSAPVAPAPDGSAGVSQLRFANLHDGWAYGPALYETSGGGWPWHQEDTFGQRVIDVEAANGSALAIFASCTGSGAGYAADCTSFSLYSSAAGSRSWTPVAVPTAFQHMSAGGQASSASLVISRGATGYLLSPTGAVLSGPVSGGTWTEAGQAPCEPGPAQASGAPAGAQLAAGPELLLTCDSQSASGALTVALYTSSNGATWQPAGTVRESGTPTSLASAASGHAVLATTAGIDYLANLGKTWQAATVTAPPGGFSYVGMTDASQGVAVPADAQAGEIYVTSDGGKTWTPSPISG